MKKPKIIAIILTFNRLEILKESLESIIATDYPLEKIIIVNNNSTDGTSDFLNKKLKNELIKAFNRNVNDGAAGGFNFGIKEALKYKCDAVILIDDEIIIKKNTLGNMVNHFDTNTILNSLVLDYYNKKQIPFGIFDLKTGVGYSNLNEIGKQEILSSPNPWNSTLIPVDVIKKIGLLDEGLFMRGESDDYIHKAILAGCDIKTIVSSKAYMKKKAIKTVIIGKVGIISLPSPIGIYYVIRNTIILRKRYKQLGEGFDKFSNFYKHYYFKLPNLIYYPSLLLFLITRIIYSSNQKIMHMKYLARGVKDGFCGRLGKYEM